MSVLDKNAAKIRSFKVGDPVHRRAITPYVTKKEAWLSGNVIAVIEDDKCGPLIVVRWWNPWKRYHTAKMYDVVEIVAVHAGKLRTRSTGACEDCKR